MPTVRDLTICISIEAEIATLNPTGQEPVTPPTIEDVREALMSNAPFGDYILSVALVGERERPMTEEEHEFALTGGGSED